MKSFYIYEIVLIRNELKNLIKVFNQRKVEEIVTSK